MVDLQLEKRQRLWNCISRIELALDNSQKRAQALQDLRELALSEHGLCSNEIRKECWPILLNV